MSALAANSYRPQPSRAVGTGPECLCWWVLVAASTPQEWIC